MYKFNQIEKLIKNNISLIKQTEIIKIKNAKDRYLAESVYSKIDIPPNNNAAVDGYLFNYKSLISDPLKKYQGGNLHTQGLLQCNKLIIHTLKESMQK